jgi:hypothetical protein
MAASIPSRLTGVAVSNTRRDQFLHENHPSGTEFCFALGDAT